MNNFENEIEVHGVKVNVNYYYSKGEPMIMYYSDMSGHPGEPPFATINWVRVGDVDIYELLSADLLDYMEQKVRH